MQDTGIGNTITQTEALTGSGTTNKPEYNPAPNPHDFVWPGWDVDVADAKPIPVSNDNRQLYSESYAKWLVDYSTKPQFESFAEGFHTVLESKALTVSKHAEDTCPVSPLTNDFNSC